MSIIWKGVRVTLRVPQPDELAEVRDSSTDELKGYVWQPAPEKVFDLSNAVREFKIQPGDAA